MLKQSRKLWRGEKKGVRVCLCSFLETINPGQELKRTSLLFFPLFFVQGAVNQRINMPFYVDLESFSE